MKKLFTQLTFLAFLLLGILACEKEQAEITPAIQQAKPDAQAMLDRLSPPIILFQFSQINLETGEESGWIIDRSGTVKTYQYQLDESFVPSSKNETWQVQDLNSLFAIATETVAEVELEELVSRAIQGNSLSKKFLSGTQVNNGAQVQSGFYAYTQTKTTQSNHSSSSGCQYGTTNYNTNNVSQTKINRLIVNLSGHINRYETSNYAVDLHNWLVGLNEDL